MSNQNEEEVLVYIRVEELIELLKSIHAGFSKGLNNDPFRKDDRIRGLYFYGSSVYENRITLLNDQDQLNQYTNENNSNTCPHENQLIQFRMNPQKHNDIDLLCVRDEFYHTGLEDLCHPNYQMMQDSVNRDVYMEQDVTLHFSLFGFYNDHEMDRENSSKPLLKKIPQKVQIEAHVMSTNLFMHCLRQHKGICCQYLFLDHDTYILREENTMKWFRTFWFRNFHFHRRLLRRMMTREADVWCYSKARRHFMMPGVTAGNSRNNDDFDIEKGKKNLIHGIRYYVLAQQMISSLTLNDWSVCNDLKQRVFSQQHESVNNNSNHSSSWTYWTRLFDPLYKENRNALAQQVQAFIDEGLQLALQVERQENSQTTFLTNQSVETPSSTTNRSLLLQIMEQYGLQYLSLNLGMDVIPILFVHNGKELSVEEGLTCQPLIQQLLEGLTKTEMTRYSTTCLENYLNRIHHLLQPKEEGTKNNFSVLFKITQNKELERMEESMNCKALRESNGMIVEWNTVMQRFSIVAFPFLRFFDEFRVLNATTKNKTMTGSSTSTARKKATRNKDTSTSSTSSGIFSNISHIRKVYKKLTGKLVVLYFYNNKWRISYKEEEEERYYNVVSCHHDRAVNEHTSWEHKIWKILLASNKTKSMLETDINTQHFSYTKKNFMLQLLPDEESVILIGVRNVETLEEEEDLFAYEHVFDHIHQEEDLTELQHQAHQLEQDLLYKNPIHVKMSEKDKNLLLLLKLLYYKSNQLDPLRFSGYVCLVDRATIPFNENTPNQTRYEKHRFKIESTFYYNLNQLSIWNISVNIQENTDAFQIDPNQQMSHEGEFQSVLPNASTKSFNRWNGNLSSQNNELLLIEMAISMLGKSVPSSFIPPEPIDDLDHELKISHSSRTRPLTIEELIFKRETFNEKIKAFSSLYFQVKQDWEGITLLYDQFYQELGHEMEQRASSSSINHDLLNTSQHHTFDSSSFQNKFVAQQCEKFPLENKTPIFKMVEEQCSHSREIFQSPRRIIDSNSLVKIWKNYLQTRERFKLEEPLKKMQ
ncbi:hypothetical protein C9374_001074 [Naegleria lovaniensis]|uniref:Uncharacterized protein n=1 Tax=Naegleria lovaniensis TaxID=51637 RepID=A0AA88KNP2_NAELO|nr:uncharacterized protein C9374_001074 [Naegleria lovaniensis]KAG2388224.1 hypothetical protein C9374_001074 [Naegleria lovaniensis]